MKPIVIRELANSPTRQVELAFDEMISTLASLTPVQGDLSVVHQGDFLEVTGNARTIVTLQCDRCLQSFNHRLETAFEEAIWIDRGDEPLSAEQELSLSELDEHIPYDGQLDGLDLIYQHLCLELPVRNLCSEDCSGVEVTSPGPDATLDVRWSALAQLRGELSP